MIDMEEIFIENPIIAAVRNDDDLKRATECGVKVVFVLYGGISTIADICKRLEAKNKIVFVHVDLIDGLKSDHKGLEFIKEIANPYGIITTKQGNIKHGKTLGFYTIQRIFGIDSLSVETAIKSIHSSLPSAVEVLPGVATKVIGDMGKATELPIIAGGLIKTKKEAMDGLSAGAIAISTTATELWE